MGALEIVYPATGAGAVTVVGSVDGRAEAVGLFVPCDAPLPVGCEVLVRIDGKDRRGKVAKVAEVGLVGMWLVGDGLARAESTPERVGPKPSAAAAKEADKAEAKPAQDNDSDNGNSNGDDGDKPQGDRRRRKRKPTLT